MNWHTIHARFGFRGRLLAGTVVGIVLAAPAAAQNGIPIFESKYELHYRFPDERTDALPATFRTTIAGTENVTRNKRETVMQYDGALGFTLAARPLSSTSDLPDGAVDLYVRLTDVQLQCRAGRGSYSILVNEDGLQEDRPMQDKVNLGPHDQFIGSHTVSSLLAKPSTMRFSNGALLAAPDIAPMLVTLDCGWMYTGVTSMLPPLPSRAIVTGRTWKAGMPVRLSVFGQPQIIRFDFKFEEYNEQTHVAFVSWNTNLANTSVVPVPGVHHIGSDAIASGTITGRMRLHVDSGIVLGSEMNLDLRISHIRSSGTTVRYIKKYTLENLDHPDPAQLNIASAAADEQPDQP